MEEHAEVAMPPAEFMEPVVQHGLGDRLEIWGKVKVAEFPQISKKKKDLGKFTSR